MNTSGMGRTMMMKRCFNCVNKDILSPCSMFNRIEGEHKVGATAHESGSIPASSSKSYGRIYVE